MAAVDLCLYFGVGLGGSYTSGISEFRLNISYAIKCTGYKTAKASKNKKKSAKSRTAVTNT